MKILTVTLVLSTVGAVSQAQERFKPGQWEITSSGADNPGTTSVCMTPAATGAVNGPVAAVRANAEKSAALYNMKITNFTFDGTTISMTMVSGANIFVSRSTYRGDTYESTIVSRTPGKETTKTIKGKRTGACP